MDDPDQKSVTATVPAQVSKFHHAILRGFIHLVAISAGILYHSYYLWFTQPSIVVLPHGQTQVVLVESIAVLIHNGMVETANHRCFVSTGAIGTIELVAFNHTCPNGAAGGKYCRIGPNDTLSSKILNRPIEIESLQQMPSLEYFVVWLAKH